jgi:hypothetical protein
MNSENILILVLVASLIIGSVYINFILPKKAEKEKSKEENKK